MLTRALMVQAAGGRLEPVTISRRTPGPNDVSIAIRYCGLCHSDLYMMRGDWPVSAFPCVPGHEIVGAVTATGAAVSQFAPGDVVAVGCMIDSCRVCRPCVRGQEQYCVEEFTSTYGGRDRHTGEVTLGGYAQHIVVDAHFVLPVLHKPEDLPGAAPLVCAGVTMWSPLKEWKAGPGVRVGVVGLGGLGHIGVKLAKALGAEVTVFTTSPTKLEVARRLGADEAVLTTDPCNMAAQKGSLDLILNSVSSTHDIEPLVGSLAVAGTMVMLGLPADPAYTVSVYDLVLQRRRLAGSHIGGIGETRELLAFCAQNDIVCDVELIHADAIAEALGALDRGDASGRFVLDLETLPAS